MSFNFVRAQIPGPAGRNGLDCWLPAPEDEPEAYAQNGQEHFIDIELDDESRTVLWPLVAMAVIYNAQHVRRVELGHDCGVFALSCESGDPYADRQFSKSSGDSVFIKDIGLPRRIDEVHEGVAAGAGRLLILAPERFKQAHLVVQATADDLEPLYLSKIGTDGPVVLSGMEQIAGLYDAAFAAEVSRLLPG